MTDCSAEKLRVVHVIGGLSIGGAERQVVNLLNAMRTEYRAVVFIGPPPVGPSFHEELDDSVGQHFVRIRRRSLLLGLFQLVRVLKRISPDVVHTHMFDSNLYGSIAAKLAGVPLVVTSEHGENPWKKAHHRWLERCVVSRIARRRYCVSDRIRNLRRDIDGIPASKLRLATNGTPLPALIKTATNEVPLIGAVGRFVEAKDYPTLIRAALDLRDQGFSFKIVVLGDGPEWPATSKLIQELALTENVNLIGAVSNVAEWYRKFDIFVSSSVREGQPVTILEAMSYAIPIVATRVGASVETVGGGGVVVEPGESGDLASAIAGMLADDAKRTRLGKLARMRVEQTYSVEAIAEQQLADYKQLLPSR